MLDHALNLSEPATQTHDATAELVEKLRGAVMRSRIFTAGEIRKVLHDEGVPEPN